MGIKNNLLALFLCCQFLSYGTCYGINGIIGGLDNFVNRLDSVLTKILPGGRSRANFQDITEDYTYDFIVVGSGSSGSIIANRLSEITSWKILLLEAGNPGNILTDIPILAPLLQLTPYNWDYTMQHQDGFCMAMEDEICAWPRGKALGGTSVINYMIYTRGNPKDFEKWAARGNIGWSYKDVLPYYLKSENCDLSNELCKNGFHNEGGYLTTEYPFSSKISDEFLRAGVELGAQIVDYNSENYMGYAKIQANMKKGRRQSTANSFIYSVRDARKNLKIITSARVTKILIDEKSLKTYGVKFRHRGKTYVAKASKEVILSAGVLNSPQLLMLSGIGPEGHLKELGIPLIKNLPVGQLLYDHIAYLGLAFKINQNFIPKDALFRPSQFLNWFFYGRGIYTSLGGIEALAYINTESGSIPDKNYPDIELLFVGTGSLESDYGLVVAKEIRLKRQVYETVFKPLEKLNVYNIIPMLLHPKSRGYMKLRSKNPFDKPLFYGNYFDDPQDIKTLLASIRYIQKLSNTKTFQKYNSTMHDIPIPGCEGPVFDSDAYWECALRSLSGTLHHQIGTCKMGPVSDEGAVVNQRLKVYGIEGLRVADSSVIPVTLSAHTNAPSMMIGEKAADMIKEDWG